jgi:hypothetical protein
MKTRGNAGLAFMAFDRTRFAIQFIALGGLEGVIGVLILRQMQHTRPLPLFRPWLLKRPSAPSPTASQKLPYAMIGYGLVGFGLVLVGFGSLIALLPLKDLYRLFRI